MAVENTESQKKTTTLGDFEIKKKLGQGGMGVVYLAHQVSLDRDCALKVMAKELAAKPGFVDRFVREARSMAKIHHPNVVSCYAVGEDKGLHYVAMELVDGRSMQDWLNAQKQLQVSDALLVTALVGEALHYAHELNMVHRDVKPDNILVTKKGVVKLSDLGLAKAVDDTDMSLTQSGTGMGTPHYMAPEQARNAKHVDRRCDVYALGCTLYHFLAGKPPFSGETIVDLITNKEKGKFTPVHRVNKEVPERLSLMIDKAMAQDPKNRYQSCADFVKDLEGLGLASSELSFIDSDQRTTIKRKTAPTTAGGAAANMRTMPMQGTAATKPATLMAKPDSQWYVKYEENGKVKAERLTAIQVLSGLKSDKFNERTQASVQPKGPYLPLAQIPVFDEEARKMIVRQQAAQKNAQLKSEYDKLAKQYDRQWIGRFFHNLVNGTLGFVGFLVLIAVLAAIGVGLYFFVPDLYKTIAGALGL
ncbi:serine/threonine protein kinase [Planctomicrobium piriforme]|uniref:non-specific serine/threonine protein kinase n=1 Tax=Planctomicrobium piriforme TaxID=1576369 RepID=A0A1I3N961_9PLAN|nr:serine/threonine-protein kinase [Planctomicrobium piriforme]SFJ05813.1 serine/threonine protein kinase [Planctomicrobium piriforme]